MVTASNAGANSLARLRPKNPENEFNAENRFTRTSYCFYFYMQRRKNMKNNSFLLTFLAALMCCMLLSAGIVYADTDGTELQVSQPMTLELQLGPAVGRR
jgi:hypothetical protein